MQKGSLRRRRGITLAEVMMGATISFTAIALLIGLGRFNQFAWQDGLSNTTAQLSVEMALSRIVQQIREARSVVTASSGAGRITLQMPGYDGSGMLVTPLTNGQIISYYLSDSGGSTASSGNILWRSVNNVSDSAWSLKGDNTGRVKLATGGLTFTYYPSLDAAGGPESVVVSITATSTYGTKTNTINCSQEVVLRNKGL
ncbi:MAG: hypothetical protein FJX77_14635 [Armatimonadetes bacterium]|nr:hypothetical protein [Armatimonadota bacterium]MBM3947060.1 hypothetical protein [SAR202 cluster bacterium]